MEFEKWLHQKSNNKSKKIYKDEEGNGVEYTAPFDVNNQIYFCGVPRDTQK